MSFGFKKKLYTSNKKNETKEKEKERLAQQQTIADNEKRRQASTVITNPGLIETATYNDDNGNTGK